MAAGTSHARLAGTITVGCVSRTLTSRRFGVRTTPLAPCGTNDICSTRESAFVKQKKNEQMLRHPLMRPEPQWTRSSKVLRPPSIYLPRRNETNEIPSISTGSSSERGTRNISRVCHVRLSLRRNSQMASGHGVKRFMREFLVYNTCGYCHRRSSLLYPISARSTDFGSDESQAPSSIPPRSDSISK